MTDGAFADISYLKLAQPQPTMSLSAPLSVEIRRANLGNFISAIIIRRSEANSPSQLLKFWIHPS
jgi:hypothetical protein